MLPSAVMSERDTKRLLGARLKQIREEKGLRAEEVAALVGVSRQHLYNVEKGEFSPSVELLVGLAIAYHVDVADFWTFPTEHPRHQFRELARRIPSAKLGAMISLVEDRLQERTTTREGRKKTAK